MNELIFKQDGRLLTTSRLIANEFHKRHDNVLSAIAKLDDLENKDIFFEENFNERTYSDAYNREKKEYLVTEKGFMLLVMGFTGKKAQRAKISFINAFDEMKRLIDNHKPKELSKSELAQMVIDSENENKLLQQENERLVPLAEAVKILSEKSDMLMVGKFGSMIGVGQNTLYKILRDLKILIPAGERKNLPYQQYVDKGYFQVKNKPYSYLGEIKYKPTTYITGRGQIWLYRGLKIQGHELQGLIVMEEMEAVV